MATNRISEADAIATLLRMFPDSNEALIRQALRQTRGSVDLAVEWLLQQAGDGFPPQAEMGVSSQGAVYGGQEGPPRPAPAQSALPADFLSLGGPAGPGEIVDAQAQADEELARRLQQQETMRALHDARYAVHNGSRHGPERRSGPPERRGEPPAHRPPPSHIPQKQSKPDEKKDNIFKKMGRGIKNLFTRKKNKDPHATVEYSALPMDEGSPFSPEDSPVSSSHDTPVSHSDRRSANPSTTDSRFSEYRDESGPGHQQRSPRRRPGGFSSFSDE